MANTLLSVIISDAYRESNLTSINTVLTQPMLDEGLRLLQRVILSVYGNEEGEALQDLPVGNNNVQAPNRWPENFPASYFAPSGSRIVLNIGTAQSIAFNPSPQDGARMAYIDENSTSPLNVTFLGNGRRIEGALSYNATISGSSRSWMYDAPSGNWLAVTPLTFTDVMPFPSSFDDLFIIMLAMRLNPRYNVEANTQSVSRLSQVMRHFKARYSQVVVVGSEPAIVLLPGSRAQRGYWYGYDYGNATDIFNRGGPFGW